MGAPAKSLAMSLLATPLCLEVVRGFRLQGVCSNAALLGKASSGTRCGLGHWSIEHLRHATSGEAIGTSSENLLPRG